MEVELQVLEAYDSMDFPGRFDATARRAADALLVLDDAMFAIFASTLVDLSNKHRPAGDIGLERICRGRRPHVACGSAVV